MASRRRGAIPARAVAAAVSVLAAGTAAGVALQRRYASQITRDPEYRRLTEGLYGRPLPAVSADGTRLHVEEFGCQDGPTFVLAHGWTEQLRLWGPVIDRLSARGGRVVAYDLRGHGTSGRATEHDYGLARMGEDLEAVLTAVTGHGERAIVVGHSLGAMAIAAWAEHHDVVAHARAAVMVNTGLGDLLAEHLLFGALAKRLDNPLVTRLTLGSRAPIPPFSSPLQSALIRYVAFGTTATAAQVAFYERMLIACPPDVRAACGVAMSEMNLWPAVVRLSIPTLVLAGAEDRLTPSAHARRIAETLPDPAGLIELPGAGHMLPLERPDQLSDALTGLISD